MTGPRFTLEAFHHAHLPEGGTEVDAIVAVTAAGTTDPAGAAGVSGRSGTTAESAVVVLIDCSGSMGDPSTKIAAARRATRAAIDALPDGVLVAVVAGRHDARTVFPAAERLVVLDRTTRPQAHAAVETLIPSGGTAIGSWLTLAHRLLAPHPRRLRHAILLTDGKDEHESPEDLAAAVAACEGVFTCDARGVGTDWVVDEVRGIAARLLGSADIVAEPERLATDFEGIVARAMGRGVGDVALRVWAPRGATVRAVKQVSPTVEDLTDRRTPDPDKPLVGLYPTGAWGDETREYHVRIAVEPLEVGEEVLAARIGISAPDAGVLAETRVPVTWTADSALATRLDERVAHYTGQAELAAAIQDGLDARRSGDVRLATARLGRAVALAEASGHRDTAALLARVVDVEDPVTGRVRLRREVSAADEMTLDVRSTRTARVREGG